MADPSIPLCVQIAGCGAGQPLIMAMQVFVRKVVRQDIRGRHRAVNEIPISRKRAGRVYVQFVRCRISRSRKMEGGGRSAREGVTNEVNSSARRRMDTCFYGIRSSSRIEVR